RLLHRHLGGDLVAHGADRLRARADEDEAGVLDPFGEIRVLREEAVAGMDRLGVGHLGRTDDGRDVEVAVARGRRPDAYRFVGEHHVLRVGVGLRMHGDRLDAELAARPLDSQRDLAAVGDQYFFKHRAGASNVWPLPLGGGFGWGSFALPPTRSRTGPGRI